VFKLGVGKDLGIPYRIDTVLEFKGRSSGGHNVEGFEGVVNGEG